VNLRHGEILCIQGAPGVRKTTTGLLILRAALAGSTFAGLTVDKHKRAAAITTATPAYAKTCFGGSFPDGFLLKPFEHAFTSVDNLELYLTNVHVDFVMLDNADSIVGQENLRNMLRSYGITAVLLYHNYAEGDHNLRLSFDYAQQPPLIGEQQSIRWTWKRRGYDPTYLVRYTWAHRQVVAEMETPNEHV